MQADGGATPFGETPGQLGGATPKKGRSRWDMTPAGAPSATPAMGVGATPMWGATPGATPLVTPSGMAGMETPTPGQLPKVLYFRAFLRLSLATLYGDVHGVCCVVDLASGTGRHTGHWLQPQCMSNWMLPFHSLCPSWRVLGMEVWLRLAV